MPIVYTTVRATAQYGSLNDGVSDWQLEDRDMEDQAMGNSNSRHQHQRDPERTPLIDSSYESFDSDCSSSSRYKYCLGKFFWLNCLRNNERHWKWKVNLSIHLY